MSRFYTAEDLAMGPQIEQHSSHMVMTNVSQENRVKYVNIDSKFRDDYDSHVDGPVDFMVTLPSPITHVQSMKVENIEIPLSFYNVSKALGNSYFAVDYYDGTGDKVELVVTIPDGQYDTIESLADAVQTAFNNASNNASNDESTPPTVIVTTSDSRVTISATLTETNSKYVIKFPVSETGGDDKYNVKGKLGWTLGFTSLSETITPVTATVTATNVYDLTRPRVIYMYIDEFSQSKSNSFTTVMARSQNSDNIIAKISTNRATNIMHSVFLANEKNGYLLSDHRYYNGKCDIKRLRVQLLDEFDRKIDLNGLDFSFSLRIVHK